MNYDIERKVDELWREKQRRDANAPGCLGTLWILANMFGVGFLIIAGFIFSIPHERSDATGARYLCWTSDNAWPWEDQASDWQSCIVVHHERWRTP